MLIHDGILQKYWQEGIRFYRAFAYFIQSGREVRVIRKTGMASK